MQTIKRTLNGPAAFVLLALFTTLCTFTAPAKDWSFQTINVTGSLSNILASTGGAVTSNSTTQAVFNVPQGCDWSLIVPNTATNANSTAASATVYSFDFSHDNVIWTTGHPLQLAVTENGTQTNGAGTNFVLRAAGTGSLAGYQYGRMTAVLGGPTNQITTTYYKVGSYQ